MGSINLHNNNKEIGNNFIMSSLKYKPKLLKYRNSIGSQRFALWFNKQSINTLIQSPNFNFTSLKWFTSYILISKFDYQINISEENEKSRSFLKDDLDFNRVLTN
ncbi:hypothetical protein ACTFIV_000702 [Dictyostelium citrinum]